MRGVHVTGLQRIGELITEHIARQSGQHARAGPQSAKRDSGVKDRAARMGHKPVRPVERRGRDHIDQCLPATQDHCPIPARSPANAAATSG